MKRITNWLFVRWWADELIKNKKLKFINKIEAESQKSKCIAEVLDAVEGPITKVKGLVYKLHIKTIENERVKIQKDETSKKLMLKNPVFVQNEIVSNKAKFWWYGFLIVLFTIGEVRLNYLIAALFIQNASVFYKWIMALVLTVVVMVAVEFGLSKHFLFLRFKEKEKKNEGSVENLKEHDHMRKIGIACLIAAGAVAILVAASRILFLDHIDHAGLTDERFNTVQISSRIASYATLFASLLLGVLAGIIKRDLAKSGTAHLVQRHWHRLHVKRNGYTQDLKKACVEIVNTINLTIEKHWQLIIDSKRILQHEFEVDEKYTVLDAEYVKEKSQRGFIVDNDVYRKYSPLQSGHEELFKHGILNEPCIKEIIEAVNEVLVIPDEHIKEHLKDVKPKKEEEFKVEENNKYRIFLNKAKSLFNHTPKILPAVCLMLLASCGNPELENENEEKEVPMNVIVMPDLSVSDTSDLKWYKEVIADHVLANLGTKDRCTVLPIDYGSVTSSTELYRVDFSNNVYSSEMGGTRVAEIMRELHQDSITSAKNRFCSTFDSLVRERRQFNMETDIIGALRQARKYSNPNTRTIIILLSDMQQYTKSGKLNLEKDCNSVKEVDNLLIKADSTDLSRTEIMVFTGAHRTITPEKYQALQNFWTRYFIVNRGYLLDYNSGGVSIMDEKLKFRYHVINHG